MPGYETFVVECNVLIEDPGAVRSKFWPSLTPPRSRSSTSQYTGSNIKDSAFTLEAGQPETHHVNRITEYVSYVKFMPNKSHPLPRKRKAPTLFRKHAFLGRRKLRFSATTNHFETYFCAQECGKIYDCGHNEFSVRTNLQLQQICSYNERPHI